MLLSVPSAEGEVVTVPPGVKVSPAQMRGEQPIERIDRVGALSDEDYRFIEAYKRWPESVRHAIREVGNIYEGKKNPEEDPAE